FRTGRSASLARDRRTSRATAPSDGRAQRQKPGPAPRRTARSRRGDRARRFCRPGPSLHSLTESPMLKDLPVPSDMRLEYDKRLMLVSGRANPELAAKIAAKLGVSLSPMTLKTFSNGEIYCRFEESVRGADVFIVQPTCANEREQLTANDALMELLAMVDAAVGGSAHRVIAVTPWYGYSRQDKKSAPREPITARLVAHMLEAAGIDRILTMDLHSGQIQGFFQKPCDHMTALVMLTQYFDDLGLEDLVVVAPDAGRVKLNKRFASRIGADLAILNKERPAQQVAEINYVIGDVKGK